MRRVVIAAAIACLLGFAIYGYLESRNTGPTEQQRREWAQLDAEARNRLLGATQLRLDSGLCINMASLPAPWQAIAHDPTFDQPQYFTVTAPLAELGFESWTFRDAEDAPAAQVDRVQVGLGAQLEESSGGWPSVRPLQMVRNLNERDILQEETWEAGLEAGLRLYRRSYRGRITALPDEWTIVHLDPRTQCQTSFGMISLMKFASCVVTDPARAVSARFDLPGTAKDDVPTMIDRVRSLVTAVTTVCADPVGRRGIGTAAR